MYASLLTGGSLRWKPVGVVPNKHGRAQTRVRVYGEREGPCISLFGGRNQPLTHKKMVPSTFAQQKHFRPKSVQFRGKEAFRSPIHPSSHPITNPNPPTPSNKQRKPETNNQTQSNLIYRYLPHSFQGSFFSANHQLSKQKQIRFLRRMMVEMLKGLGQGIDP